jgi:hypothetical protein
MNLRRRSKKDTTECCLSPKGFYAMYGIELMIWSCHNTVEVFPMIAEEMQPPDAVSSVESKVSPPKDLPEEDPDKIRGEVFKRMFPDVPPKAF